MRVPTERTDGDAFRELLRDPSAWLTIGGVADALSAPVAQQAGFQVLWAEPDLEGPLHPKWSTPSW